MGAQLNILFIIGILILLLATVGCGKIRLQSVTIGDPDHTYHERKPPRHFQVYDVDTGRTLSCSRYGGTVSCTE